MGSARMGAKLAILLVGAYLTWGMHFWVRADPPVPIGNPCCDTGSSKANCEGCYPFDPPIGNTHWTLIGVNPTFPCYSSKSTPAGSLCDEVNQVCWNAGGQFATPGYSDSCITFTQFVNVTLSATSCLPAEPNRPKCP